MPQTFTTQMVPDAPGRAASHGVTSAPAHDLTQAPGPSLNQVELRIQASLDRDRMITSRREGTRASVEAETVRSAAK